MEQVADSMPDPNQLRLMANGRFAANALDEALPLYSLAVDVARKLMERKQEEHPDVNAQDPDLVIHLCNRSACFYKMEMFEEARDDAAEAVSLCGVQNSNSLLKSLFRLARAQIATKDFFSAMGTIKKATSICEEQLEISKKDDDVNRNNQLSLQMKEFSKLSATAQREQKLHASNPDPSPQDIKSIKLEPRTPSIKEFIRPNKSSDAYRPLGEGNFSTVVICQHKITMESFALKIIEKEGCKKLAKRQHPNVYNEVAMERRILTTDYRLPCHVNIIRSYHAMQDYGNLYFLMELHQEHGDLWNKIRYRNCMVGCHSSLIRTYAYELLSAIEHCHKHGVVHRDIKPENVLLSERGGHVILIDFGTAKDLIVTDLNGPEFVGTPDFMSPEAVKETKNGNGCDFTADLWAFGVVLYQLYAGALPFESQSPYLGFLKIQRGVFNGRNIGIWDDDGWDLIHKLLKVNPKERLGAGCFEWVPPPITEKKDFIHDEKIDGEKQWEDKVEKIAAASIKQKSLGKVITHGTGYDIIRKHSFFAKHELLSKTNSHLKHDSDKSAPQPIPSLQDIAIRATAHFIDQSSLDVDLEDLHPPGDGSSYDALRLKPSDRRRVMHLLDRLHLLKEPRIYRRFFHSKQDARLGRIRPESRDVIGLTQMNDRMGQFRGMNEDQPHPDLQLPASKLVGTQNTTIHHITNPLFSKSINFQCARADGEEHRKLYVRQLKESLRLVNRVRPTVVVACGYFDDTCRKLLSKVNETVPVILHNGDSYFNFWIYGAHCVALPLRYLHKNVCELDDMQRCEALAWFRMELEQIKTARSHGYVFVDGDPREIPPEWIGKMGKSHVLGLLGLCNGLNLTNPQGDEGTSQEGRFEKHVSVANLRRDDNGGADEVEQENEDQSSTSSSDSDKSDDPKDEHVMHIVGRLENGVRCITVREEDVVWDDEILL